MLGLNDISLDRHKGQITLHKIRVEYDAVKLRTKAYGVGGNKMNSLNPSMRLKVKRDTFFLPDPGRGVYFRNNTHSFQLKGHSIDKWVEKLIPMFNGMNSLENLTYGLPDIYRNRVYEIAEILYRNGFLQDVSKDLPHQLSDKILEKYASQIEFLQNFADSGAYRFQKYRQKKVLAIGSGSILVSLISSLIESGLPKFHVLITESVMTNRNRIQELVQQAQKSDSEVEIKEVPQSDEGFNRWKKIIQPYDAILYVSQEGNVEELRLLNRICRDEAKLLLPAICLENAGLAGPIVHPDSSGSFESLWRSLHQSALCPNQTGQKYSVPAGTMLANVIVFELFKAMTGVTNHERQNQFFLINYETLEGNWHLFMQHPILTGQMKAKWVEDIDLRLKRESSKQQGDLIIYFSKLTSVQSGIFHILAEEELIQLPLAQCRVQVIDPLSEGPAELLPSVVCAGFTHYLARKEAGLTGIESYVSRMKCQIMKTLPQRKETEGMIAAQEYVGIGAGETFAEAVCRGLQRSLTEELNKRLITKTHEVVPVELSVVEDEQCRYYLQVLTTMHGSPPIIGIGKELFGFPIIWAGTEGRWFVSVGLNTTLALRKVLKKALLSENNRDHLSGKLLDNSSILLEDKPSQKVTIEDCENTEHSHLLKSAIQVMEENQKQLLTFEIEMEPILKKELLYVYGVLLREEEAL